MLTHLVFPALQSRLKFCGVFAVRNLADNSDTMRDSGTQSQAHGTICAPSIIRNVARLLQRGVSSAPEADSDQHVVPHVAELILQCAAGLRQVHPSGLQNEATLTGRWLTSSDLATYLEECEADNAAVPFPEVSTLRSWLASC